MQQEPAALKQFNHCRDAWRILKLESHPIPDLEGTLAHTHNAVTDVNFAASLTARSTLGMAAAGEIE